MTTGEISYLSSPSAEASIKDEDQFWPTKLSIHSYIFLLLCGHQGERERGGEGGTYYIIYREEGNVIMGSNIFAMQEGPRTVEVCIRASGVERGWKKSKLNNICYYNQKAGRRGIEQRGRLRILNDKIASLGWA